MPALRLTFLNAFQAALDGALLTTFRSANVRGLLVYLSMQAEKAHARDVLATLFWPNEPDSVAKTNLRQSIYQLRKVLGDSKKQQRPFLIVSRQAVQFNPQADFSLDVSDFLLAMEREDWETAVSLYAGDLLPGFANESEAFEDWLRVERERLNRLALEAMHAYGEQLIRQENLNQAQRMAQQQLGMEPWREEAHQQLMQTLALSGERTAALAQFDRCYEALQSELGIEPNDQTIALYEQIATSIVAPTTVEQKLPQPVTPFVGRLAEISHLIRTLQQPDCRLLTLLGAGGAGKTRLAVAVAHQFEAQTGRKAHFVSLLGVETAVQLLAAVGQQLGLSHFSHDELIQQVVTKLAEAASLLVLDNAEGVLTADGEALVLLLNMLTAGMRNGRFLVTSRQPMRAQQEWLLPISGLPMPPGADDLLPDRWEQYDSLRLFVQRAQQANITFALTRRNVAAVTAICQRLEGLPLGIELAAAQVSQRHTADILADLPTLTADLRDLPPRHRSLTAVFEQSWVLLAEEERRALAQTAVFDDGFSRAAGRAVLGELANHLDELVRQSLLRRVERPDGQQRVRFMLPTLLQTFLRQTAGIPVATYERFANYYLAWAVGQQGNIGADLPNVQAAWGWVQAHSSVKVPRRWRAAWLTEAEADQKQNWPSEAVSSSGKTAVLVGRDAEVGQLRVAVARLRQGENGGLMTVIGDAGLGKTHLVSQLRQEETTLAWFDCPCDESSAQSLRPFRLWLRDYFNQQEDAEETVRQRAFAARFEDVVGAIGEADLAAELRRLESMLAALVELPQPDSLYARLKPAQRKENFQQAIKALVKAESRLQPLILHVEDGHWIDVDSRELLVVLLRHVADCPFGIVVTARPSGFEPLLLSDVPQQTIRLTELTETAVVALAEHHLGATPEDALLDLLLDRGDGNPFYTEQLLLYLRDNGLVARGKLVRSGGQPLVETQLPLEMQNLLAARLGRLPEAVREVVAQAAVLGQEFSLPTLRKLVDEELLAESLALGEKTAVWHPLAEGRYLFNHALLHEAAVTTQFDEQRQELHQQAARAEVQLATKERPNYASIAVHYDEAANARQAVNYYLKAGDEAMQNYFIREAHNHYSRGLALAEREAQRLKLYLGREAANHWLGNREQQKEDLRQLVGLTAESKEKEVQAEVWLRRATFALATADYETAVRHAKQACILSASIPNRVLEAQAYHRWGRSLWQQGQTGQATPILQRALRLAQAAQDKIQLGQIQFDLATLDFYASKLDSAKKGYEAARQLFAEQDDKRNLLRAVDALGQIEVNQANFEAGLLYFEQNLATCQAIDWLYMEIYALAHLGDCHFELGDYSACRTYHEQALQLSRSLKEQRAEAVSLDTIGLSYYFEGLLTEAQVAFRDALAVHESLKYPRGKAFVQTHLGLLLTDMEEMEEAGVYLYDALAFRSGGVDQKTAVDTEVALAWLDMAQGEMIFAVERVRMIVMQLEAAGTDGIELPLQVYWQCFTILSMAGETEEANHLLTIAHGLLQAVAVKIQDPLRRQRYLEQVPYHRKIRQAWLTTQP